MRITNRNRFDFRPVIGRDYVDTYIIQSFVKTDVGIALELREFIYQFSGSHVSP